MKEAWRRGWEELAKKIEESRDAEVILDSEEDWVFCHEVCESGGDLEGRTPHHMT